MAGTISIGNVAAMSTGGLMSVQTMMWVSTGCAALGALVVLFSAKSKK